MEHLVVPLSEPRCRYVKPYPRLPRDAFVLLTAARSLDIGKVLAGVQVPPEDNAEFDKTLKQLGYTFVEETNNAVYKRHLQG